ncbi:MAG: hypothetical protein J5854_04335 [Clostridia bacterium]|nr:hypothetical protein [Clostridia bacterium]
MEGIELLVFIVDRGRGDELLRLGADLGAAFNLIIHGEGTAPDEMLRLLGLERTEKDIVFLSVKKSRADELLDMLADEMKLDKGGNGIAFSIPFSALAGQFASYELFSGNKKERQEEKDSRKGR